MQEQDPFLRPAVASGTSKDSRRNFSMSSTSAQPQNKKTPKPPGNKHSCMKGSATVTKGTCLSPSLLQER